MNKTQLERDNKLSERLNQLAGLYHDINMNPIYTDEYKDDLFDCLTDCWQALKKFYEVENNEINRPD